MKVDLEPFEADAIVESITRAVEDGMTENENVSIELIDRIALAGGSEAKRFASQIRRMYDFREETYQRQKGKTR